MYAVFVQVVPVHTGGEMSQGIEVVVGHGLGLAARATGEIHQHGVFVVIHERRTLKGRCLGPLFVPVVKPLRHLMAPLCLRVHRDERLHGRAVGHGLGDLCRDIFVVATDDGLDACPPVAIGDVSRGEHVGGGNGDGTQFAQCHHRQPPLIVSLEDKHHLVAVPDAKALKVCRDAVGLLFELPEGGDDLLAALAGPYHAHLVGVLLCPSVHHVVGEVEMLGYLILQVLLELLLRSKVGLRQKFLYHFLGCLLLCPVFRI